MNQQRGMNMSKKYFTKYLPVEGEIKEGAIVKWANYEFVQVSQAQINNSYDIKQFTADGKCYKLFLCSRDNMKVGDKIRMIDNPFIEVEWTEHLDFSKSNTFTGSDPDAFKVIGEISERAKFVKENDEFDFKDLQFAIYPPDHEKAYEVGTVHIKCPCCDTFL